MANEKLYIPEELHGQILASDTSVVTPDNKYTFQGASLKKYRDVGGRTFSCDINWLRDSSGLNPNVVYRTIDFGVPIDWQVDASDATSLDDGGSVIVNAGNQRIKGKHGAIVPIRAFGVNGNGIFDDSTALQNAVHYCCENKKDLNLEGLEIGISVNIAFSSDIRLTKGTIKALGPIAVEALQLNGENVVFDDVVFDGNETTNLAIKTNGVSRFKFKDSEIRNLKEVAGCGINTYGIWMQGISTRVDIFRSNFSNITPIENGIGGDVQGSARAIIMRNAQKVNIDFCTFDTINGLEDGDCVQVQTAIVSARWNDSDVTVSNSKFYNVKKRAIKLQASKCYVYSNTIHSETIDTNCTLAAIDTFGASTRIHSNKIYLKRATCAISVGSIYHVGDVSITDNECYLNTENLYESTDSSSRLAFIKVSSSATTPITNFVIHNNQFNGYAAGILFTSNTYVTSGEIKDNYFNCGGISSHAGCFASDFKLNQNTFIGSGSTAGTGKGNVCLQFIDVDGVYVSNNTFVSINSWHLQPQGAIGVKGLHFADNNLFTPNNRLQIIRTNLITSGTDNLFISEGSSRKRLEGSAAPTIGTWYGGDMIINTEWTDGGPLGWVCISFGTPGIWREFGIAGGVQAAPQADFSATDITGLVAELNGFLTKLRTSKLLDT